MLNPKDTALIVVDVQGKLAEMMADKTSLFSNIERMVLAAKKLSLPILWAEQLPQKLGPTISVISQHLEDITPITKSSFSCTGNVEFMEQLAAVNKKQLLIVGIEAHICVMQTVLSLLTLDYQVHLVCDAISARNPANKELAIKRCSRAGAVLSGVEMALFELMQHAEHSEFKFIQQLIK
jgi:nicotinamidase-related amidase